MKRLVIQTTLFSRSLDAFIDRGQLSSKDYLAFESKLVANPTSGDVIPGLLGLRKARLKCHGKGKRSGFRVDYLDVPEAEKLYLVVIYPKNAKSDLSPKEKKAISRLVNTLKEEAKNG